MSDNLDSERKRIEEWALNAPGLITSEDMNKDFKETLGGMLDKVDLFGKNPDCVGGVINYTASGESVKDWILCSSCVLSSHATLLAEPLMLPRDVEKVKDMQCKQCGKWLLPTKNTVTQEIDS